MSIAAIKTSAFEQLSAIEDEVHLKQILDYLTMIAAAEKEGKQMTNIFEKAVSKYGTVLEKLAR
jgi:hypothetical protein